MDDIAPELWRVNALMNEYAKEHGTLDGFEEWLIEHDRAQADRRSIAA